MDFVTIGKAFVVIALGIVSMYLLAWAVFTAQAIEAEERKILEDTHNWELDTHSRDK